jgi:hypothetical protein
MKVLGIRNSPTKIRFCILQGDSNGYVFNNCLSENKIDLPKSIKDEFNTYLWIKSEFERIFDKYGPFDHLAIKQNENVPARYSTLKPVMFIDCIATIVAIQNNTPFSSHSYNSLGTKSKEVVAFAESKCQKTATHWDSQIADAVAVCIKNIK